MRIALGLTAGQAGLLPLLDDAALRSGLDTRVDLVTLEDGFADPGGDGPDALLLANWLGARTGQVGILAGAALNFLEPFHVSTAVATLDHVTEGRGGLLAQRLGGGRLQAAHRAIGALAGFPVAEPAALAADLGDALTVIRALWDSWQDDAVIRNPVSQRYLDADRLHPIRFQGQGFSVLGPSITPRPPQGQPLVALAVQAGENPAQAAAADLVFLGGTAPDLSAALAALRGAAATPLVFADVLFSVDGAGAAGPPALRWNGEAAALAELGRQPGLAGLRLIPVDPRRDLAPLLAALPPVAATGGTLRQRLGLPKVRNRYIPDSTAA